MFYAVSTKSCNTIGLIGDIAIGIVGAFIGDWLLPQIGLHLGKELSRQSSTPEEPTIVAVDIPIGLPAPETGAALVSGQRRTFKTTVALDVSVCVMADLLFAGRYRVKRRRAVLYIALEGESMLAARLSAIAGHRGVRGPLPFARRGDCPALTAKDAVTSLCAFADEAAADLDRSFGLPPQAVEPKHHQENSGTNDIEHPFAAH